MWSNFPSPVNGSHLRPAENERPAEGNGRKGTAGIGGLQSGEIAAPGQRLESQKGGHENRRTGDRENQHS